MVLKAGSEVKCCGDHALFFLLYNRIIIPEEHTLLAHLMILVHVQFVTIPSKEERPGYDCCQAVSSVCLQRESLTAKAKSSIWY